MMNRNTHGGQKEGMVDRAKDMLGMGHKGHQDPYVDPAVPQNKQDRYGNETYANQGGTIGNAYDTTPGYDPTAAKAASGAAYGTSSGIVGTETGTGSAYTTPGYGNTASGLGGNTTSGYGTTGFGNTTASGLGGNTTPGFGTTAEYGTTGTGVGGALGTGSTYGTGHPDKAAVLDSYGAIVTEPSHAASGMPVDPLAQPAVIGVDAAGAHGAPVIPSTYNVDHNAHTTGPVVGAVDHNAAGLNDGYGSRGPGYGTTDATRTGPGMSEYNAATTTGTTAHSTTATTGSTGTEHEKKGFMANIKEKVHDITDKLHHKK